MQLTEKTGAKWNTPRLKAVSERRDITTPDFMLTATQQNDHVSLMALGFVSPGHTTEGNSCAHVSPP